MTIEDLFEVWNFASVSFAILSGVVLGYVAIGKYASDPAYASGEATPNEYGVLTGGLAAALGLVFFGFQIMGTYIDGDPAWTRVVSRLGIWIIYCVAIGAGTAIRLRRHVGKKHSQARARAEKALRIE